MIVVNDRNGVESWSSRSRWCDGGCESTFLKANTNPPQHIPLHIPGRTVRGLASPASFEYGLTTVRCV
eukprot:3283580-Rhodomonas_salina.1